MALLDNIKLKDLSVKHYELWRKEINKVSWNGAEPKWDIREWNEEHDKSSKGTTLSDDEAKILLEIFNSVFCYNILRLISEKG